jgi:2-polyprenyl-3-methyl-5-hydroxy-6-metoxy-1,4-benzoquinol methylase|tara:strand:- start:2347 stop:3156 length:810 start_codon:yes stop_codon:yes gene_type:complete
MKNNSNLKLFYNKVYKKGEEKHFTSFVAKGTPTDEVKEVLKELNWKNKLILDVGCGTGLFAYTVSKLGPKKVLGIDFSKEAIDIAQKTHKNHNLQYQFLDVKEIKLKYDVIVSLGTLEHMDNPLKTLKTLKKHLNKNGKIIITSPNWTNPRGYILMTLWHLFNSPITLADLHYQTPVDFQEYAKKLNMNFKWRTIDRSWAHGDILISDFKKRIPNVLKDSKLPNNPAQIKKFLNWIESNVLPFDNSLPHSGATGLYIFSFKKQSSGSTV